MRRAALVCLALASGALAPASAQGFQTLDPFYGGETARRGFYDGLALSGEVGYRGGDLLGLSEPGAPSGGGVAVMGRIDYAILPQVDLSAVADLSGGVGRGPLGLSWVVIKPHWHNELTDYAVRVAVDPASEGGLGFRQTDAAFLSSTALSPEVTTDFAVGIRRVRTGYTDASAFDAVNGEPPLFPAGGGEDSPTQVLFGGGGSALLADGERVRLVGQELRAMLGYNVVFDPAGSRLILGLVGEAGDYARITSGDEEDEADLSQRIRSGIGWARLGVEFSRPSYQLAPYVSLPIVTWADVGGESVRHGPRPDKVRFGLRATLR